MDQRLVDTSPSHGGDRLLRGVRLVAMLLGRIWPSTISIWRILLIRKYFATRNPPVGAQVRCPSVSQGTLEFACHLWYAFYFVLCADADGNVSLLRSDKLPEAVGTGAAQVPITVGLGALLVTGEQGEERMRWLILGAALSAAAAPALAAEFILSSTEVKSGSPMGRAQVYTACNGQNISPALSWSGEPTGTQSFAVTMYDPDARAGAGWWHWTVFNIPTTVHSLAAGAGSEGSRDLPAGAGQGRNDFGVSQYSGPCPPVGDHAHHYEITVYAVKVGHLPLDSTASGAAVSSQLRSNTLTTAKIVGRYERSN